MGIREKKSRLESIEYQLAQLAKEQEELEQELEIEEGPEIDDIWPKRMVLYVHNEKWDEGVMEFAMSHCGFKEDSEEERRMGYIAYEVALYYDIHKDGSQTLVGVKDGSDILGDVAAGIVA